VYEVLRKKRHFLRLHQRHFLPTSRRLNVVVRFSPLYPRSGPKWRDNYPEGPSHPVFPNRLESFFSCSHLLTGRSWTTTLFFLYDQTLIYSPPFILLLILLLLLVSENVHPNPSSAPVRPTNLIYPCCVCSPEVGQTSIQCSRCKRWVHSTCSRLPGPTLRSMFFRGDVGGWVCPPCSPDPPHQAPTTVMNHPSTMTTIASFVPLSPPL